MLIKLVEILEQKAIKYFLLTISIIVFFSSCLFMLPQVQNFIIKIAEIILCKELSHNYWKNYLFEFGYKYLIFGIFGMWYFLIRKKFIVSLCFLLAMIGIYMYISVSSHGLVSFTTIVLLFIMVAHIIVNRQMLNPLTNRLKDISCWLSENRFLNSSMFVFSCGGLLGALFFIHIFGIAILDFTYTDWLMPGCDLSQHYLGWKLFRNSAWYFPVGLMDNIVHPFMVSIIFTDSIPLFAIGFKLLSPVLPKDFQYFGLFGILCYSLQGGIGTLIVKKIGGNTIQSIMGSIFFILSTVMMWRIYAHTSLAAHLIILLCILMCLQENQNLKKSIFLWGGLLALSASIHIYFIPMVLIFMFFRQLYECLILRNIKSQLFIFSISFFILIGTIFCLGGFYFVENASDGGLGFYSANLNALFNPQGMSCFLKSMPLATAGQYEGNAYLGLGVIILLMIIITNLFLQKNKPDLQNTKRKQFFFVFCIILSFLLFSLSPVITLNQYVLFKFPVGPIERIWGIFRGTGRMTWPVVYLIITICIWWIITKLSNKRAVIFLIVLLMIQWIDLKPWLDNKGSGFKSKVTWQTKLSSPVWNELVSDYKHIFFLDYPYILDGQWELGYLFSFLDMAGNHRMTTNDAYLARKNTEMINMNRQSELKKILNGESREDTIYVFMSNNEQISSLKNIGMHFYLIDNIIIALNTDKSFLENYMY